MSQETILFELRVTERGVEVYESEAWRAYHRTHRTPRTHKRPARGGQHRPTTPGEVRRTLESLQRVYDELYRAPANQGA